MGDYLPTINLGNGMKGRYLQIGQIHSCVILQDFDLKCWGLNSFGNLGQGNNENLGDDENELGDYLSPIEFGDGISIQECLDYSPTVSPSLNPSMTFSPSFPLPTFEPSISPSIFIGPSCQSRFTFGIHVCALTKNGKIKCWGHATYGQCFFLTITKSILFIILIYLSSISGI